jgi:hypothetical protein
MFVPIFTDALANFVRWADLVVKSNSRFDAFDYEVFMKLAACLEVSKCVEQVERDPDTGEQRRDEDAHGVLNRMTVVGCRVTHSGLSELAERIGVSKSKLEKQLRLWREIDLIVNEANGTAERPGFIELNAMVVWRGSRKHKEAYLNFSHGRLVVI